MDAFDADVLIYAAIPEHPLGRRVLSLFPAEPASSTEEVFGVGSVLLLPKLLTKPIRDDSSDVVRLEALLSHLDLRPVDHATARLATILGATYNVRAADAVHLATAVTVGADRFITNNSHDFAKSIAEIDITYPHDLPDH